MAVYPFLAILSTTVSANGTGTVSYACNANEKFEIHRIMQAGGSAFNITGINTSDGRSYTNANATTEILASLFQLFTSSNRGLDDLPIPLVIESGTTLTIELEEIAAASSTIDFILVGVKRTGNDVNP